MSKPKNMTPEQEAAWNASNKEYQRKWARLKLASLTPEERRQKYDAKNKAARQKIANESPDQRKKRREKELPKEADYRKRHPETHRKATGKYFQKNKDIQKKRIRDNKRGKSSAIHFLKTLEAIHQISKLAKEKPTPQSNAND